MIQQRTVRKASCIQDSHAKRVCRGLQIDAVKQTFSQSANTLRR